MQTLNLCDFAESVPTCKRVDTVSCLSACFRQAAQHVVALLDWDERPVGLLQLYRWLPYIQAESIEPGSDLEQESAYSKPLDPPTASAQSAKPSQPNGLQIFSGMSIEDVIQSVYQHTGQWLLEPVAIAPESWTVDQFFVVSQASEPPDQNAMPSRPEELRRWLVVNGQQQLVGLLNDRALWQAVASQTYLTDRTAIAPPPEHASSINSLDLHASGLHGSALSSSPGLVADPSSEAPDWHSHSQGAAKLYSVLAGTGYGAIATPLAHILEEIPLPIMVQTCQGRVILQNNTWRHQIGELQDPMVVRQQLAAIFDADKNTRPDRDTPSHPVREEESVFNTHPSGEPAHSAQRPLRGLAASTQADTATLCHAGTEPNSCVCLCPMKNGQERIWQFIRIPLLPSQPSVQASTSSSTFPDWTLQALISATASTDSAVSTEAEFHLAQLDFPDLLTDLQASVGESRVKPPTDHFFADPDLVEQETLWLILAQDTTEQQQTTRELAARNADLLQLNRLKDEFLACITHELKTPLTAVLGLSGLLKEEAIGPLNQRQARYVHLIHQSGRRLVFVVNDILDLTRIETGQVQLNIGMTDIHRVSQQAFEEAVQIQQLASRNLDTAESMSDAASMPQFFLEIQPGLHHVLVDELRLRQMLTHLLSNALKFTDIEGRVGLQVSFWESWFAFTVWDTGIGIPLDQQHLIFQKFQQLEHPLTRKFEGTGLGLVLTQRLAQLHGGDVTFTSAEGKGSRFTVLLPQVPTQVPNASIVEPAAEIPASSLLINRLAMIVTSEQNHLDTLTEQLAALGYRVVIARSGTEALGKARRLQPRVILLNSTLPLLSGWDVLTLLKSDSTTAHVPILFMVDPQEGSKATDSGADAVLMLPVRPDSLHRLLRSLVKSQPTARSQKSLIVLYLNPTTTSLHKSDHFLDHRPSSQSGPAKSSEGSTPTLNTEALNTLLHPYHCRVLEVDDLAQAELLSRVWKPDVILLGHTLPDPAGALQELSQNSRLASLPLVTLTPEVTEIANRVSDLKVFPCLDLEYPDEGSVNAPIEFSPLLEVIQVATGVSWVPKVVTIHALDFSTVAPAASAFESAQPQASREDTRLQSCVQYLQMAGLHSSIISSFDELVCRLEAGDVDVLMIYCPRSSEHVNGMIPRLDSLKYMNSGLPVVVWIDESLSRESDAETSHPFAVNAKIQAPQFAYSEWSESSLREIVDDVISFPSSAEDVLATIRSAIAHRLQS